MNMSMAMAASPGSSGIIKLTLLPQPFSRINTEVSSNADRWYVDWCSEPANLLSRSYDKCTPFQIIVSGVWGLEEMTVTSINNIQYNNDGSHTDSCTLEAINAGICQQSLTIQRRPQPDRQEFMRLVGSQSLPCLRPHK